MVKYQETFNEQHVELNVHIQECFIFGLFDDICRSLVDSGRTVVVFVQVITQEVVSKNVIFIGYRVDLLGNIVVPFGFAELMAVVQNKFVAKDRHDVVAHFIHVNRRKDLPIYVAKFLDHLVFGTIHWKEVIILADEGHLIHGNVFLENNLVEVTGEIVMQGFCKRCFSSIGNA